MMMMMMIMHCYDDDFDTDDENGEDFNTDDDDGDEVLIQKLVPQTSDGTQVGQYANFGPTNVGLIQTSDTNKLRTRTNVEPVKASNG